MATSTLDCIDYIPPPYDGKYNLNFIKGIPFPPSITEQRFQELANFQLRPDDVFIVTYPKSGTTWTQQIVNLLVHKGVDSGEHKINTSIPWIEEPVYDSLIQAMTSPRYFKSHTNYELMVGGEPAESPAKYIYVARNPKDTAVSLYHHTRGFKSLEFTGNWDVFFDYFINNKAESGSWFDHVLEWWKHRDADNILFIKYEDMQSDLTAIVKKIAVFLNFQYSDELIQEIVEKSSFDAMKVSPSASYYTTEMVNIRNEGSEPFLRKGVVGDWRNHFTQQQLTVFDKIYHEKMKETGLDFRFE